MVTLITETTHLSALRSDEKRRIGFVPTMGNLHSGHISLLKQALAENEVVYFSIFVNPKQFGPSEDFNKYPRTLEKDVEMIMEAAGSRGQDVFVFAPRNPEEVFPPGNKIAISVTGLNDVLEGKHRPGHFEGVATVVYKLFHLVKPHTAYFGLKDYQQYLVIKNMVSDLQMPIKIIGMPIIRDSDGLALSSRNQYLSFQERKDALELPHTLSRIKEMISQDRTRIPAAQKFITEMLKDKRWNYLELRDADTLSAELDSSRRLSLLAVFQLGTTRLLDNLQMELK